MNKVVSLFVVVCLYWCKIDGVYASALLKISNSPFCVIPFHSCLFVLPFVSFFLDSEQTFFFSFVISCSHIFFRVGINVVYLELFLSFFSHKSLRPYVFESLVKFK